MRHLLALLVLTGALALPALASPEAMVTRVTEAGEIVVNRGVEDQITPGTHWYVYRNGQPVAEVEVVLVDSYNSRAKVVQGSSPRVGDKVTDQKFASAPPSQADVAAVPDRPAAAAVAATPAAPGASVGAPAAATADQAQSSYDKLSRTYTRTESFAGGARASNDVKIDPINTLNMFSTFGYNGQFYPNIWNMISVGAEQVGTNVSNANLYQDSQLEVQVTWWNEALLESYADSLAFRENKSAVQDRLMMRSSLYAQKGLDRYMVFQVKLKNTGPGTVQVAPFHWHMYLVDAQGNRVKAERYDQILDRTLNPDQSVEGSVYFMKLDVAGRPLVPSGKVKIVLEDILGERGEMTF